MTDQRQFAPATQRNREPILAILRDVLPPHGLVLEIASGTGEHVVHFANNLPGVTFQPSDPNPVSLASIRAWIDEAGGANVRPPVALDAAREPWPVTAADAIVCINMIHISPWSATEGLLRNAARLLPPGAPLVLYGPYIRARVETAPSNMDFDADLRGRNPDWGLRDLDVVAALARREGFSTPSVTQMPANNLAVVFRRT
jgi:SAM-dependent methyltransferase